MNRVFHGTDCPVRYVVHFVKAIYYMPFCLHSCYFYIYKLYYLYIKISLRASYSISSLVFANSPHWFTVSMSKPYDLDIDTLSTSTRKPTMRSISWLIFLYLMVAIYSLQFSSWHGVCFSRLIYTYIPSLSSWIFYFHIYTSHNTLRTYYSCFF